MKETITNRDYLERAVMLQVNERLHEKGYISTAQFEYAKVKIVNFEA